MSLRTPSTRTLAFLSWGAVSLIWGTTYLTNDIGIETIPPFRYAATRFLVAGVLLLALSRVRGAWGIKELPRVLVHPTSLAGTLTLGTGVGLNIWALQWLPSGMTALLVGVVPLWMVLIERFVFGGERLPRLVLMGLALGFLGIAMTAWELGLGARSVASATAVPAVLTGGLAWAFGSVFLRHRPSPSGLLATAGAQMVWAAVLQGTVSVLTGESGGGSASVAESRLSTPLWWARAWPTAATSSRSATSRWPSYRPMSSSTRS